MIPQEIIDRIAYYLSFQTAIEISPYLKIKLGTESPEWREYAKTGNLFGIKWLHYHEVGGCETNAMDYAAMGGHLDVVKWLHENRQEGCTVKAIYWAAAKGHLNVVKWLHENRPEVSLKDSLWFAASWGHLEVVKWMIDHLKPEDVDFALESALDSALIVGEREVGDFLQGTITSRSIV